MTQIVISYSTIDRIEKITGKKLLRGGDKLINETIDILEGVKNEKGRSP